MPKFIIEQFETIVNRYEIESEDMTQALIDFREHGGDPIGQNMDFGKEANNEIGISFEEIEEKINTRRIISEFNMERRNEYIESINSIEQVEE